MILIKHKKYIRINIKMRIEIIRIFIMLIKEGGGELYGNVSSVFLQREKMIFSSISRS